MVAPASRHRDDTPDTQPEEMPEEMIDFGFQQVPRAEKQNHVRTVFDSVAGSYDIMNDLMSLGIHRLWKDALMDWLAPRAGQTLVDLAGGTGDVALRFLQRGGGSVEIIDINTEMLAAGQKRRDLADYAAQLRWTEGNAENLPVEDSAVDRVTIAFGLRNVTDRQAALAECHRILKPGGRFCCLEFSHVENPVFARLYDGWSFGVLPHLGQMVAGDGPAYQYLVESIRKFPTQDALVEMMQQAGFAQVRYRNLTGGIAAIHSGWVLDK